ncbi:hypothetical protein JKP88DRAFT_174161 [Tribonema minus]|uniref:Serine/threonine-protein phosphatase 4 regulatory subunit 3-like central domain-containing protein n=1 Tax=Tribonema minus TaxID=303371 RepID=A0A836CNG3_9STRA|nr:hypothetical protein JKP88DRAFT_174161 [Tribonema minus]
MAASAEASRSVLFWVIWRLTTDADVGVVVQAAEVLRLCLDTESMDGQADRDAFLGAFYDHYIQWLVEPFWQGDEGGGEGGEAAPAARATAAAKACLAHLCDLLSYCVRSHTYRMKYFVLRNHIVARVLRLARCRDKFLQLAAVRFLRACVGIKDDFYNRYIVKNNLLAPVFALLAQNAAKDNLITSAIMELLEFLRSENVKSLIEYIVERFESEFGQLGHAPVLKVSAVTDVHT